MNFPPWTAAIRKYLPVLVAGGGLYVVVLFWYGLSPRTIAVGYAPEQPVPYSHALHAGTLAIDCRYCHNTVEVAAHAAIPPTSACMNCHARIRTKSPALALVRESAASGQPIPWVKVHDLPDYVYFDHSAHVTRGVGCVACHGRVDTMDTVRQVAPLSMGWCLDCHRNPEENLRPRDQVTNMRWKPDGDARAVGMKIRKSYHLNPSEDCSTCHR